jgi:hypothetical protein
MARARRAKRSPARVVVPVLVALLALVGSVLAVQRGWFDGGSSVSTGPQASPRVQASSPAAASPAESTSPVPSGTPAGPAGEKALDGCRAEVRAADDVLKAAEVGVGHWAEHVQAQTDANAGRISTAKMDAIFKRTRLAGPDDVDDYEDAVQSHEDESGNCDSPDDASPSVARQINRCAEREEAQAPVLRAAEDAMQDWESHLAAMRRSRMGHVHDAQGVWIRAWRAAPPHIEAYQHAAEEFDAPKC